MSGTGPSTPAEEHLGDRLAALVDGELKHDARERVLAHLATCPKCKAEADAQRRLKSVFAESAPPPPSEGFLARLQGLPGGPVDPGTPGGDDDGRGGPLGGGRRFADGVFPVAVDPRPSFAFAPAALPGGTDSGFRIHPVGRPGRAEAERPPWIGRRFAFAAAGAVSLAALALGGALPLDGGSGSVSARGTAGTGRNVTPLGTSSPTAGGQLGGGATGSAGTVSTEAHRRYGGGNGIMRSVDRPAAAAPPAPGLLAPATRAPSAHAPRVPLLVTPLAASSLGSFPAPPKPPLPPLIRPSAPAFQSAATALPAPTAFSTTPVAPPASRR
ncbi:anti-sigma factor family protein [Streptomyces sp. NPDC050504]|uniref:anti-sigma factor family protein n=1 Tax=Streptomyces sp. NPDC050504 TaxID=3365618 RepID=UPI0037A45A3F